ncbi:MAG: M48 family metalloprotease [Alteromonadaceae bacterium]|nr:M48 family metalloprotease [Alteromonadaceae bacterium]MBL4910810.1 M48 family metalloprotease [Alteromonadaceae bacterium]
MKIIIQRITLLIIVLSLFSCKSTGLKIGNFDVGKLVDQGVKIWDANNIDQAQEVQFGKNMSAVLLGARGLYQNKNINEYVNQVGMWLAINSSRPDLPWRFGVINSSSINAFAAPGGYVFITLGMLHKLESEAQLAAVLAHEIIHVTQKHYLNALKDSSLRGAITETLFMSAEAYQNNTGANVNDQQYRAWAKKITLATQDIYSKGLDKTDEFQADQQGMLLLAKSGYDAYALIDNLQLLASIAADDASLALLYKTHPTAEQRLIALSEQAEKLSGINGLSLVKRYNKRISTE